MHAWEAIQKTLDYIEQNLAEEIPMETLANVAALSPYYFQRLFGRLVKKPVNEYVKLRRLAKASKALENTEMRINVIAVDCGFSNHANFTRAFRGAYGITPQRYRAHPVILNHFVKPDMRLSYTSIDEEEPLVADEMVVKVTRRILDVPRTFLGITGDVPIVELCGGKTTGVGTAGGIWDTFHRQKPDIPGLLPDGNELGVLFRRAAPEGCYTYLAAGESTGVPAAEGYTLFTLPCGEYLACCFEAENFAELIGSAIFKASSFMADWIKKHNLTCGYFAAEMYYEVDPEASYMEQWLPLSPSAGTGN